MTVWLLIFACWLVSFLFAGIEAGLLSVDPIRLRYQVNQKKPSALRLSRLSTRPERLLITVLLITNMADILALLLLTRFFVNRFGTIGFFISALLALPIYLFVLGVFPKSLFRRFPFRALAALGGVLETASMALWPLLEIGERLGKQFLQPRAAENARLFAAREELKQIAVQSEREGALTSAERAMIHNVVDFRNVKARDVMLPLAKSITVRQGTPVPEVLKLSRSTDVDRLPVLSQSGDAIGLVNVLDLLFDYTPGVELAHYTRRIVLAQADEPAYRVIRRLRAARIGLAAIQDERRKLIGIVTGEDLIKRLVQST